MKTDRAEELEFSEIDEVFARLMQTLSGRGTEELFLAAKWLSRATRDGHVCVRLSDIAEAAPEGRTGGHDAIPRPDAGHWRTCLASAAVVGKPGDFRPMILDDRSRLYLYRYWDYEKRLIDGIRLRISGRGVPPGDAAALPFREPDEERLRNGLACLFPPDSGASGPDWRKVAALSAVLNNFAVISGSPGTGKTTTVAKILALLLEQADGVPLRIALAAPTGKAAVRLQEAIRKARESLACTERIRSAIPEKTSTVHRLLGAIPRSPYFRHDADNPLPYDVVVVDEASMIDLPLFSKLVQAIRPEAKLVVLGDKDQLASVEAGAVLGDICGDGERNAFSRVFTDRIRSCVGMKIEAGPDGGGIRDCIVSLEQNFRYGESSGIGRLSTAVNGGDGDTAWDILRGKTCPDIRWRPLPRGGRLQEMLRNAVGDDLKAYLRAVDEGLPPADIFDRFDAFRILCALRRGPYGSASVNGIVEDMLRGMRLIRSASPNYPGRPVMVTRNDYYTGLFNGDIGIMLPDPDESGEVRAVFRDSGGVIRKFHPLRLPEHETAYATTVHKSQGSEYDRVLIMLAERDNPVLTRELIYTAVTRAKVLAELWTDEAVFRAAVSRRIERTSGLKDALWGGVRS